MRHVRTLETVCRTCKSHTHLDFNRGHWQILRLCEWRIEVRRRIASRSGIVFLLFEMSGDACADDAVGLEARAPWEVMCLHSLKPKLPVGSVRCTCRG